MRNPCYKLPIFVFRMKRCLIIIFLAGFAQIGWAQPSQQDIAFNRQIDKAVELMEVGKYDSADTHLRYVIQNMKVLPTNISFYFGKNSLYLNRYKQSINWLSKYIELTGTSGRFFDEAKTLLDQAENNYREERQKEIEAMVLELRQEKEVPCNGNELVICPVCRGLGIVIKEKNFGKEYWPCPFSPDTGRLSCSDYNLLIEGKLKPKN